MGSTVAKVPNPALCCFKGWCMDNKLLEDDKRLNLLKKTNTTVGFAVPENNLNRLLNYDLIAYTHIIVEVLNFHLFFSQVL